MDNIMNELEMDTDEEDLYIEEGQINNLKKNFTFDDFWDYLPTRTILKNEFRQQFQDTIGKQIALFYETERGEAHRTLSNIFAFDTDGTKGGWLEAIVYNHIRKDYDLGIFYKNPEWAKGFVQWHLENSKKKMKQNFVIPSKSLRKFNWGTKKYEGT